MSFFADPALHHGRWISISAIRRWCFLWQKTGEAKAVVMPQDGDELKVSGLVTSVSHFAAQDIGSPALGLLALLKWPLGYSVSFSSPTHYS